MLPTNTRLTSYIRHKASNTCTGIWSLCSFICVSVQRHLLIISKMLVNTFLLALHLNFYSEVVSVQSPLSRFMICIRHLQGGKYCQYFDTWKLAITYQCIYWKAWHIQSDREKNSNTRFTIAALSELQTSTGSII